MRGKTIKITLVIVICIIAVITAAVLVPKATKEEQRTAENMTQEETTAQEETKLETEPETKTQETEAEEVTELTDPRTEDVTEPETETQMQTAAETRADAETTEEVTVPEIKKQNGSSVVSLSVVGDIYLSPMMEQNYRQSGISGVISPKIQSIFQSVDIAVGDHEYVCGDLDENQKVDYQQYTFLCPTAREEMILKDFSFEVMTLANNHMMDYGWEGLCSTMAEVKRQGIAVIGGGNNLDEALKPYTAQVNGKKIAILSATRVVPQLDWYAGDTPGLMTTYEQTDRYELLKQEITRLKTQENYDIVIMYVHWGNDSDKTILNSQRTLGHGYIDAGADMVIGNHTHVLQGMEFYQGKMIVYGLSNFLFGSYHSDTMVLTLEIDRENAITAKVLPCTSEGFYTQELSGEAAEKIWNYIESMSDNVTFDGEGTILQKNN